jgi:protein disulfide-isomerase
LNVGASEDVQRRMMKRSLSLLAALAIFTVTGAVQAAEGASWSTDYQAALKEAKAANKPILADFTGSDWCTWCIRLGEDTFSKSEFAAFAKDNLVLLEVDFPQGKAQAASVKKQNEELAAKFGVEGFPTLVLIDGRGKEIARHVGYLPGGPEAMIDWIKKSVPKS